MRLHGAEGEADGDDYLSHPGVTHGGRFGSKKRHSLARHMPPTWSQARLAEASM
jgi:hypothetical protein